MLTAKSKMSSKLNGLENGADDYITKPFHMRELVARVKVVLKREKNTKDTNMLEYSDLKLELRTGKMICNGSKISIVNQNITMK